MAADDEKRVDAAHDAHGAGTAGGEPVGEPHVETEASPNELPEGMPEEAEIAAIAANARRKKLGIRVASGVVLGALAAAAVFWGGEQGRKLLIAGVATACFIEFIFLVIKATGNIPYRLAAIIAGGTYIALAGLILSSFALELFLVTLFVVIFADSFAYGVGTLVGGPKIWRRVSPNKTWAGMFGGMIGATLFLLGVVFSATQLVGFAVTSRAYLLALILGPVLAVVAQAGDLFESWLKRKAGVKDSSRLIPGHGGFFDRFDGLIPVAIVVGVVYNLV